MSRRDPNLLIGDILESARKILEYTEGISLDEFMADSKTIDAVARNFEIIGEAASRLPEEFKNKHKGIPWIRITGLRNRIIHDYFGVDYEMVWNIRSNFLPELIRLLTDL